MQEKVIAVLDDLRPFLMNDGGNVELVKIEDNIVYVKFQGACADCSIQEITLKGAIEQAIIDSVPEIKEVVAIED